MQAQDEGTCWFKFVPMIWTLVFTRTAQLVYVAKFKVRSRSVEGTAVHSHHCQSSEREFFPQELLENQKRAKGE